MAAREEYCPLCGSPLSGEPECAHCRVARGSNGQPAERQVACRHCGTPLAPGAHVCSICGAENPTSFAGIPPVGHLALGFTVLAVLLLIFNLCFGPIGS